MMKYMLALASVAFCLSCSDRFKGIETYNAVPEIYLVDSAGAYIGEMTDSLRFSTDPASFYNVSLRMVDLDDNIWRCRIEADSGRVTSFYKGEEMERPSVRVDQEFVKLSVSPKQTGDNVIKFILEDRFGATAEAVLNLHVFNNIRPVAILDYNPVNRFEYEFSGVSSYDGDERFGGKVVAYEFTIAGQTFINPNPIARHIFGTPGSYTVRLRVMDNNGEFSPYTEERITVTGSN